MSDESTKIMKLMFGAFVPPNMKCSFCPTSDEVVTNKSKSFNSSYIIDQSYKSTVNIYNQFEATSPATLLTYDHDGVKMKYHFRMCTYLGDTDTFVDRYVECDGKVLLDTKYENPPYESA